MKNLVILMSLCLLILTGCVSLEGPQCSTASGLCYENYQHVEWLGHDVSVVTVFEEQSHNLVTVTTSHKTASGESVTGQVIDAATTVGATYLGTNQIRQGLEGIQPDQTTVLQGQQQKIKKCAYGGYGYRC